MANPNITIKGNLASDPEIRNLPSTKVLKMRVITNDWFKDEKGDFKNKDTSGWTVEVWGELAETAYNTLKKGDNVTVMGVIKERSFDDKEGNKRYVVEVKASSIALDLSAVATRKPKASVTTSTSDDIWGANLETPF
jgi:single-strand DNA-binding protein